MTHQARAGGILSPIRVLSMLIGLTLIAMLAADTGARPPADDETVIRVLEKNARGFETGDFALLDSLWAHDAGVTVFESGHANYGWADYRDNHLKPEIEELKNVKYALRDIVPSIDGDTAWATFKYTISAEYEGKPVDAAGLGTAVLQRRDGAWKIVHWHTSAPRKPASGGK